MCESREREREEFDKKLDYLAKISQTRPTEHAIVPVHKDAYTRQSGTVISCAFISIRLRQLCVSV